MNIVCGIDFSERAVQAADVAARLAKRLGGKLFLVHAVEPWVPTFPPEMLNVAYQLEAGRRDALKNQLSAAAEALRKLGVAVEERLIDEYADRAVIETARQERADLIVVGSHGLRAAERWLLGSVSEKIIETADRPVLVLPANPEGLRRWIDSDQPLKITAGIDATRASDAAVQWLKDLRSRAACDLTFVSVYWPPAEELRLGLHSRQHFQPDANLTAAIERDLQERVGSVPGTGSLTFQATPSWGRTGDAIAAAVSPEADLVVVGMHQRRGLLRLAEGSVSRDLLHATQRPTVFVPASLAPPAIDKRVELGHVLACTDFSETGNRTIPYALALVRGTGGTIDLVYVTHKKEERDPKSRGALEQKLLKLIPAEAERWGVTVHAHVVAAEMVPQAIAQTAERVGASAVVVGSRGQGGLTRAVLGSVARELLDATTRPVLVVPPARE